MKTHVTKKSEIEQKWYTIDATDIRLGKLGSEVASLLIGKGKVNYVHNLNNGDHVIVLNAPKVSVSANKKETKKYYRHSGYVGNLKEEVLGDLLKRKPEDVIKKAVWGMLPKTKLGRQMLKNLHVYRGAEHEHEAQKPEVYEIK